jgi:hypothetical protein
VDRILKRVVGFLRWLFSSEQLPEAAPRRQPSPSASRPGFVSTILAPETLPRIDAPAAVASPRTGFLRWLAASEQCPTGSGPVRPRRGRFFSDPLSPTALPRAPVPAPRRGPGFLRWLLSREAL